MIGDFNIDNGCYTFQLFDIDRTPISIGGIPLPAKKRKGTMTYDSKEQGLVLEITDNVWRVWDIKNNTATLSGKVEHWGAGTTLEYNGTPYATFGLFGLGTLKDDSKIIELFSYMSPEQVAAWKAEWVAKLGGKYVIPN